MVATIGYDHEHGTLRISFTNGSLYEYYLVPESLHRQFIEAPSKGTFFRERIQEGPFSFRCLRQRSR